jgi:hypothetical protein
MPQFGEFETTKQRIGSSLGSKEVYVARRKGRDGFAVHVFAEPDFLTEEDGPKRAAFIKSAKRLQLMNRSAGNGWAVVYDIGETRGSTYYATDLFAHPNSTGATLLPYNLERVYKARVQLSNESLAWVILQVARSLQHAGGFGRHGNLHNKNVLLATKNPTTIVGARVVMTDPAPEAGAVERDRRAIAELIHELCLFKKMPEGDMPFMPPAEDWKGQAGRDGGFWRSLVNDLINVDVGSRLSLEGLIDFTKRRVGAEGETKDNSFQEEDKAKTRGQGVSDTVAIPMAPPPVVPRQTASDTTRAMPPVDDEDAAREKRRREQAEARRRQEEEWAKQDAEEKQKDAQRAAAAQRAAETEALRQKELEARRADEQRRQEEARRKLEEEQKQAKLAEQQRIADAKAKEEAKVREAAKIEAEKKAEAERKERERQAREAQERDAREREAKAKAAREAEAKRLAVEEEKRRKEAQGAAAANVGSVASAASSAPAADVSTEPFVAKPKAASAEQIASAPQIASAAGRSEPAQTAKKSKVPLAIAGVAGVVVLGLAGAWLGGVFESKPKNDLVVVPPPTPSPPAPPAPVAPVDPTPKPPEPGPIVTQPTPQQPVLPPVGEQVRQQGLAAIAAIEKPSTQAGQQWLARASTTLGGREDLSVEVASRLKQLRDVTAGGFAAASAVELSLSELKSRFGNEPAINTSLDETAGTLQRLVGELDGLDVARLADQQQAAQVIQQAGTSTAALQALQREVGVLETLSAEVARVTAEAGKLSPQALDQAKQLAQTASTRAGELAQPSVKAAASAMIDKLQQRITRDDGPDPQQVLAAEIAKLEQGNAATWLAATNDQRAPIAARAIELLKSAPMAGMNAEAANALLAGADGAKLSEPDRRTFKERVVTAALQQAPATQADLAAMKQMTQLHAPAVGERLKSLFDYNQIALEVRESAGVTPQQMQTWNGKLDAIKQDPAVGQAAQQLSALLAGLAAPIAQQTAGFAPPAGWSGGGPNAEGIVSLSRSGSPGAGITMEFVDVGGGRFVARRELSHAEFMGLGISFGRDRRQPLGISLWQYDGTRASTRTNWHQSIMPSETGLVYWSVNSTNQPVRRANAESVGRELAAGSESSRPIQLIRADEAKDAATRLNMELPTTSDFAQAQQLELQRRSQRPASLADNVRGPAWTQQATAMQGLQREADVGAYFRLGPQQRESGAIWTGAIVPGVNPPTDAVDFFVETTEPRGSAIFNLFGNVAEWTSEGAIVGPSSLSPPVAETIQPNSDPQKRQASVARAYVDVGMRLAFSAGSGGPSSREPTAAEVSERFAQLRNQVQVATPRN